jgi:uncharacterized protein YgiM (DUF1202 family)
MNIYKMKILIIFIFSLSSLNAQSYLGITKKNVNFRQGPSEEFSVIKKLKPGAQLFLYSLDTKNEFYFAIEVETNEEGYVHKNFVQVSEEVKKNNQGIFNPIEETEYYNPTIEIYNNTNKTLTLKLNDYRYTFDSHQKRIIELTPGVYDYYASAALVIPDYGTERLQSNYTYSWEFYIVTDYAPSDKKKRK